MNDDMTTVYLRRMNLSTFNVICSTCIRMKRFLYVTCVAISLSVCVPGSFVSHAISVRDIDVLYRNYGLCRASSPGMLRNRISKLFGSDFLVFLSGNRRKCCRPREAREMQISYGQQSRNTDGKLSLYSVFYANFLPVTFSGSALPDAGPGPATTPWREEVRVTGATTPNRWTWTRLVRSYLNDIRLYLRATHTGTSQITSDNYHITYN